MSCVDQGHSSNYALGEGIAATCVVWTKVVLLCFACHRFALHGFALHCSALLYIAFFLFGDFRSWCFFACFGVCSLDLCIFVYLPLNMCLLLMHFSISGIFKYTCYFSDAGFICVGVFWLFMFDTLHVLLLF